MTDELAKEGMSGLPQTGGKRKKRDRRLSKKEKLFLQKRVELGNWTDAFLAVFKFEGSREQATKAAYRRKQRMSVSRDYREIFDASFPDEDLATNIASLAMDGDRKTRVQASALAARIKKWDQPDQDQQRGIQVVILSGGQVQQVKNNEEGPEVIDVKPEPVRQIVD
jgi:hypothetical protein